MHQLKLRLPHPVSTFFRKNTHVLRMNNAETNVTKFVKDDPEIKSIATNVEAQFSAIGSESKLKSRREAAKFLRMTQRHLELLRKFGCIDGTIICPGVVLYSTYQIAAFIKRACDVQHE